MERDPSALSDYLASNPHTRFIHHHWVDLSGILKERVVTKRYCLELLSKNQNIRLSPFSLFSAVDSANLPRKYFPGGWTALVPDWTSLRKLHEDHASVMCCVAPEVVELTGRGLAPFFTKCPRGILQSVIDRARTVHGISFLAGFELEFYLIDGSGRLGLTSTPSPLAPLDEFGWSAATSEDLRYTTCLASCVVALEKAGIAVQQYHSEAGPHQFEISTHPLPILDAIDAAIQAQQIVRITARQDGLHATFQPRPKTGLPTSGLHVHLSMTATETNLTLDRQLYDNFIAGILSRLSLLCIFGMPSPNSYHRVASLCTGQKIGWGTGNRDMPIRKIAAGHWELRVIDAIANLYLTLAAFVSSGLLGIDEREKLLWKDCSDFVSRLSNEETIELGLLKTLPVSLSEAMFMFDQSRRGLDGFLGADLLDLYAHVKRMEVDKFKNSTEEEQDLMYRRYV